MKFEGFATYNLPYGETVYVEAVDSDEAETLIRDYIREQEPEAINIVVEDVRAVEVVL